jgi:hypothetical protein
MTLRDVMTQEEHEVAERGASQGMQLGDLLFGQLASVDRLTMLEACNGFAIPPIEKAPIIELRAHIASAHPVITNQVLRERDFELLDPLSRNRRSSLQSAAADAAEHRRRAAVAAQTRVRPQCPATGRFRCVEAPRAGRAG